MSAERLHKYGLAFCFAIWLLIPLVFFMMLTQLSSWGRHTATGIHQAYVVRNPATKPVPELDRVRGIADYVWVSYRSAIALYWLLNGIGIVMLWLSFKRRYSVKDAK